MSRSLVTTAVMAILACGCVDHQKLLLEELRQLLLQLDAEQPTDHRSMQREAGNASHSSLHRLVVLDDRLQVA